MDLIARFILRLVALFMVFRGGDPVTISAIAADPNMIAFVSLSLSEGWFAVKFAWNKAFPKPE